MKLHSHEAYGPRRESSRLRVPDDVSTSQFQGGEYIHTSQVGELMRELRINRGVTQEELARLTGSTQSAIARLETGNVSPKLETVSTITSALGYELLTHLHPKGTTRLNHKKKTFTDEIVHLDGNAFSECSFIRCTLVFSAATPTISMEGCGFDRCNWEFAGAAGHTIGFMTALYHGAGEGGRNLVESTFEKIRKGEPSKQSS